MIFLLAEVVWEPVKHLYSLIFQVHWFETPLGGGGGLKCLPKSQLHLVPTFRMCEKSYIYFRKNWHLSFSTLYTLLLLSAAGSFKEMLQTSLMGSETGTRGILSNTALWTEQHGFKIVSLKKLSYLSLSSWVFEIQAEVCSSSSLLS